MKDTQDRRSKIKKEKKKRKHDVHPNIRNYGNALWKRIQTGTPRADDTQYTCVILHLKTAVLFINKI